MQPLSPAGRSPHPARAVRTALAAPSPPDRARRTRDRVFYSGMAAASAALVFAGFSRSYYLAGRYHAPPLTPLRVAHGAVFTAWIVLFVVQTVLIAARRTAWHRRLGVAGAALAAAMVGLGTAMAITAVHDGHPPPGVDPRAFLAVPLFDLLVFAPLVAAGVALRRRPEAHRRLMLLATLSLLGAAAARLPAGRAYGPPFFFGLVDLLVLAGPAYDLATRRRVHPAYVWGGLAVVASQPLRLVVGGTAVWLAFADLVAGPR